MQALMDQIKQESRLQIEGASYDVLSKTIFVTAGNPNSRYAKVFLSGHHVLVIGLEDEALYYGQDRGNLGDDLMTRDAFEFEGVRYHRIAADYQIVVDAVFGDPLETEGEVRFVDFADDSETLFVSLGLVTRTEKRADVVARLLRPQEILVTK